MTLLALLAGLAVPAAMGWLALACAEGRTPVLGRLERLAWSLSLGVTLMMFGVLLGHWAGAVALDFGGFVIVSALLFAALGVWAWRSGSLRAAWNHRPAFATGAAPSRGVKLALGLLLLWTGIKLFAGAYDLANVPTYWDDSFNNWNMRGKMFYELKRLELTIPVGNGVVQSEGGVSSYPPTVPLMKTWLASVRGGWEEPLVNGVHMAWFLGLLASAYFLLRRCVTRVTASVGVYALVSLPLLLIHGVNPYADVFVAAHVLAAAGCVWRTWATAGDERRTWTRLAGMAIGLLVFTKNEALLLYAPVLAAQLAWTVLRGPDGKSLAQRRALVSAAALAAAVALPWLAFKWTHGLSFGNAKSIGGMAISFRGDALYPIWYHLTNEPNWLLLPLLLPLLVLAAGRRAWNPLTVFVTAALAEQFAVYTFTPLANEAIMQTGLSRGLLHLAPVAVVLAVLLIDDLRKRKA